MREEKRYYVYIMASRSRTLYTGVTGDLYYRALQHKRGEVDGFTKRYHINRLVYYEEFKYVINAIDREKQIKAWTRAKRLALITSDNPTWQDLADGWGERFKLQIPRSQNRTREECPQQLTVARDDKSERVVENIVSRNEGTPSSKRNSEAAACGLGVHEQTIEPCTLGVRK